MRNGHDVSRVTHPKTETMGIAAPAALGLGGCVGCP